MKLVTIIKIFNKILSSYELKLIKKENKYAKKMGVSKELHNVREILDKIDKFLYEETGKLSLRHYRWFEFKLD